MTTTAYPAVLMFGGPGSGKGTQGVVIGMMPNLAHFAMGDIFRALDKQSDLGREFLSYSTQGLLVPDEFTVRLFKTHIQAKAAAGKLDPAYHTLVLDGIPRTTAQVELLAGFVDVRRIVHLMVEDTGALAARLAARAHKQNRPDDADPDVIRRRIEVYEEQTRPVLDAYDSKLIAHINGDQHPLAVLRDVAACLIDAVPNNL